MRRRQQPGPETPSRRPLMAFLICLGVLAIRAGAGGGTPAPAHHSFAAEFDATRPVTIEGVVTKVEWTNPHVWFFVNVRSDETGETVNWGAEMGSPNALARTGWTPNTMRVGMVVTVNGSRAKDGGPRLNTRSVMVDGERLGAASSQQSNP